MERVRLIINGVTRELKIDLDSRCSICCANVSMRYELSDIVSGPRSALISKLLHVSTGKLSKTSDRLARLIRIVNNEVPHSKSRNGRSSRTVQTKSGCMHARSSPPRR